MSAGDLEKLVTDWDAYYQAHPETLQVDLMEGCKNFQRSQYPLKRLEAAIRQGGDIHAIGSLKPRHIPTTLLMDSIVWSRFDFAFYLIDAGVDVNCQDQKKDTALLLAVRLNEDAGIVERLLEKGADPLAIDEAGNTILFYAAKYGSFDRLKRIYASSPHWTKDMIDRAMHGALKERNNDKDRPDNVVTGKMIHEYLAGRFSKERVTESIMQKVNRQAHRPRLRVKGQG